MIRRGTVLGAALAVLLAAPLAGQSILDDTPNVRRGWTLSPGQTSFVLEHRFEFLDGDGALLSFPTLTLATGMPFGITGGLGYSSNSEIVPRRLGGDELEVWLRRPILDGRGGPSPLMAQVGYNSPSQSVDLALLGRAALGPFRLLVEGRAVSRLFGSRESAYGGAVGAIWALTRNLSLSGDIGSVLSHDTVPSTWSAGVTMAIPGSPHHLSFHASNTGVNTMQAVARSGRIGLGRTRYGFTFTVPLQVARWTHIVRPPARQAADPDEDPADLVVEIVDMEFEPRAVRIRAGETVEWVNRDQVVHTVTGDDGEWGSELMFEGERFRQRFDEPGRYPYHCLPHPEMVAVVIVEPAD